MYTIYTIHIHPITTTIKSVMLNLVNTEFNTNNNNNILLLL